MVEKAVNTKAKAGLQLLFGTREINARCLKRYRLSVKKDKDDTYQEYYNKVSNKDKDKIKSYNFSFTNQHQIQAFKKDKHDCWGGYLAMRINITKIIKKDKDKSKNLSYIKYYTCK